MMLIEGIAEIQLLYAMIKCWHIYRILSYDEAVYCKQSAWRDETLIYKKKTIFDQGTVYAYMTYSERNERRKRWWATDELRYELIEEVRARNTDNSLKDRCLWIHSDRQSWASVVATKTRLNSNARSNRHPTSHAILNSLKTIDVVLRDAVQPKRLA